MVAIAIDVLRIFFFYGKTVSLRKLIQTFWLQDNNGEVKMLQQCNFILLLYRTADIPLYIHQQEI